MKKIIFGLMFLFAFGSINHAGAATDTLIRHDSIKVFIDRLIIENPDAIKRLTEPYNDKISPKRKICGWAMITSGVFAGAFSIFNLSEGTIKFSPNSDDFQSYLYRKRFRKTGFYEINICLSVGLIAAGASMLLK